MQASSRRAAVTVRAPVLSRTADGRWRVGADVDGTEVHLTADEPLAANGDGFLASFLLPAARCGAPLEIDADVDRRLHDSVAAIQGIAGRYWGFRGGPVAARRIVDRAPGGGGAMFFTAGVDSFHTLRRRRNCIANLIFVRGLNIDLIDLDDATRFDAVRTAIVDVARELGIGTIFAEANLRTHPTFARVGWDVAHVAALAGVAHALAPVVSRVYVAGSDMRSDWGSTPELDPLWSSGAVEIVEDGTESPRLDKVKAIADWPLVHRHLKVCYASRGRGLNCGRCEKCARTQAQFAIVGALDRLKTFPRAPLLDLVDGVAHVAPGNVEYWTAIREHAGDARLKAAITRLLARRPSAIERLKGRALWLRRTATGRLVRRIGKRLLDE